MTSNARNLPIAIISLGQRKASFRIKILFILTLLYPFSFLAQGQNKSNLPKQISGYIIDQETQEGIPFANVVLVRASDSTQIMGMSSLDSGYFRFRKIPDGRYFIQAAVLGYHRSNSAIFEITSQHPQVDIGKLPMQSQAVQLDKVVVRAKRPMMEMKAGKITMNVSQAVVAQADNAFEMLKKFPGVSIDKDDNISLNGQKGVLITVDDRPTRLSGTNLANLLKSMPGNTIEKIEVMNNPSSRYDAEGSSGIINIKTSRSQNNGFSGSVNLGSSFNSRFGYNGGLNLNYRHRWFTVYGNLSVYGSDHVGYMNSYNLYEDGSKLEGNGKEKDKAAAVQKFFSFFGQGGIDVYASRKDIISLGYRGSGSQGKSSTETAYRFYPQQKIDSVLNSMKEIGKGNFNFQDHNLNLNYEHTFDSIYNRKLNINAEWIHNRQDVALINESQNFPGEFATSVPSSQSGYSLDRPFSSNIYSFTADYSHPFNEQSQLEAGIKFSFVDNFARNIYQDTSYGYNDLFNYREAIGAAYLMYSHTFKTMTSIQLGLRGEYTFTKGHNINLDSVNSNSYIRPFPNISISQVIDPKNTLSISYRYRLTRPSYSNLNPFEIRSSIYSYQCGNPFLQPEYSHTLDLSYSFNYKFFATLSYIHSDGEPVSVSDYMGLYSYTRPINAGKSDQLFLSLNTQLTFFDIWRLTAFINGGYGMSQSRYHDQIVKSNTFNSGYWINTEVDVHKQVTLSAYSWGQMPEKSIFGKRPGSYGGGLGIKAFFFDQTLSISASLDMILSDFETLNAYPGVNGGENISFSSYRTDRFTGRISINYRFGNNKMMNRAPRQIEKSEEASRLGNGGNQTPGRQ